MKKSLLILGRLIFAGEHISDKINIIKCFFKFKLFKDKRPNRKISIRIGSRAKIRTRENKPNDVWMCVPEVDKKFFDHLKISKPKKIIDMGVNIGRHSLLFAEMPNTRVLSFEPEINNFNALFENIKFNKFENITPYNLGGYNENKKVMLNLSENNDGGHSIVYKKGNRAVQIEVVKLDDFLDKVNFGKVDLMKIDVEGVELEVLQGAKETLKKYHPEIFFETFKNLGDIKLFLESKGYVIRNYGGGNYLAKIWK